MMSPMEDTKTPSPEAIRTTDQIAADPQIGDIYDGSWGYDQTNAEFWQVVKRTPSTVTVRKLESGIENGRLVPVLGVFYKNWDGDFEEKVCRLGGKFADLDAPGAYLKMKSYYGISPWDGTPQYDTYAAGLPGH